MNKRDYHFLLSERATLNKLISQVSSSDVIGRRSLQARLEEVEEGINVCEEASRQSGEARPTFQGRSVDDGSGKPDDIFRVVHTADWHLGKTLNDQSRDKEHELFLTWLLKKVEKHAVDVLVIAGDVFDSANPPQSAQSRYYDFVSQLYRKTDCSLVVTAGNHDSPLQLEAPRQVLRELRGHVAGFLPEDPGDRLIVLPSRENPRLVIAAIPFLRDRDIRTGYAGQDDRDIKKALTEGIERRYAETAGATAVWAEKGVPVLATGHLTVVGVSKSDSEREIHIGGLGAISADTFPDVFSYVALGHLHRPQKPNTRVVYSGSPIALSFSEANDAKEIQMLDFAGGTLKAQTSIPVPVFRRLVQIRTSWDDLPETMRNFVPEAAELKPWVEVLVEDAGSGEDINETVQNLAAEREFDVLKVVRENSILHPGMHIEDDSDDQAIERILEDPKQVFEYRLDEEPAMNEERKQELKVVFAQLLDLHEAGGADT